MKTVSDARQKATGHANRYQAPMILFQSGNNYTYMKKDNFESFQQKHPNVKVLDTVYPAGWDHEKQKAGTIQSDKRRAEIH